MPVVLRDVKLLHLEVLHLEVVPPELPPPASGFACGEHLTHGCSDAVFAGKVSTSSFYL